MASIIMIIIMGQQNRIKIVTPIRYYTDIMLIKQFGSVDRELSE